MADNYLFTRMMNISTIKDEKFDLSDEKNAHLLEDLKTTIDGKILSVNREKVIDHLNDREIFLIRMGRKPFPKSFEINNDDDFWRFMAHMVDLDEDY